MSDVETLIVGAGPVGLFLATELLRRGRECVVIDRNPEPSGHSKALAIMPRTLEIFAQAGIVDAFVAELNRIQCVRFVTPRINTIIQFSNLQTPFSFVGILPQWRTEALLRARLHELGGRVEHAHALSTLDAGESRVRATIESPSGTYEMAAHYVVGCDGVYSTVREAAKIAFEGGSYPQGALLGDVPVETDIPLNEAQVHVNREGVVTLFPINAHLRRVVVIAPSEVLPPTASAQWLQPRMERAGYCNTTVGEPFWSSSFRVHHRVASAMRSGRIFLAGDAAHTQSPVGGQGMNVGLHDAWNLAAKLAQVLAGQAPKSLLDSYELERLPVARNVVRRTHWLTRALADPRPAARFGREVVAPLLAKMRPVHERIWRDLSLIDHSTTG